MWLTKQLDKRDTVKITSGQVAEGGFSVTGEQEYSAPEMLFPYGFSSLAEGGEKAVMLNGFCAGVSALPESTLQEGEVRLYSAGGAEILLKNTGEVVINGQVFPPK